MLFETFVVVGILVFPLDGLEPICAALGKRHPHQDQQLQFTRRNWWAIRDDPERFQALGMRLWLGKDLHRADAARISPSGRTGDVHT